MCLIKSIERLVVSFLRHPFYIINIYSNKRQLIRKNKAIAQSHAINRIMAINYDLSIAKQGYTLLAGDSHAELLGKLGCDDTSVVNAGIGGLSARHYAPHIDRMKVLQKAHAAVLIIGTNDIMCRSSPLTERARTHFEISVTQILDWLSNNADNVFVLAIPPFDEGGNFSRDPKAAHLYSKILQRLCSKYGHHFHDPFLAIRTDIFGLARSGALRDGVHLLSYEEIIITVKNLTDRLSYSG